MRTLTIDGKEISIAENFNELTSEQLFCYVESFYLQLPRFFWLNEDGEREPISIDCYNALQYAQLLNLLKIDLEAFEKFTGEDVVFLIDEMGVINFLLEECNLTINHVKQINSLLFGPDDDFGNISGLRYMWAEKFYIEFKETLDASKLDAMIACLCNQVDFSNKAVEFDINNIQDIVTTISQLDAIKKTAILLYFEGCRNEIPELYPFVFSGKKAADVEFMEVLLQVAKDGPFGDFDKVLNTNIHLIFSELNRVSKEAIEFERNNKK